MAMTKKEHDDLDTDLDTIQFYLQSFLNDHGTSGNPTTREIVSRVERMYDETEELVELLLKAEVE